MLTRTKIVLLTANATLTYIVLYYILRICKSECTMLVNYEPERVWLEMAGVCLRNNWNFPWIVPGTKPNLLEHSVSWLRSKRELSRATYTIPYLNQVSSSQ